MWPVVIIQCANRPILLFTVEITTNNWNVLVHMCVTKSLCETNLIVADTSY